LRLCRAAVFVAKHHDGFGMFKSNATDYNIMDHSGFSHDPYGELCASALKHGIQPGFYYSHGTDWRNFKGNKSKRVTPEADEYFEKIVYPQLAELCAYAKPFVIWFDLGASKSYAKKCLEIVRKYNLNAIVSSRIGGGYGDFQTGGDRSIPRITKSGRWETCMTFNIHWTAYPADRQQKTAEEIIQMLATVRARGGNLLLNLGPDVRGRILLRDQEVFLQVGAWLKKNGASIYGIQTTPYHDLPPTLCASAEEQPDIFKRILIPALKIPVGKEQLLSFHLAEPHPSKQFKNNGRAKLNTFMFQDIKIRSAYPQPY
jgi:alpha-L-fucosidase